MSQILEDYLRAFQEAAKRLSGPFRVSTLDDYAFRIEPKASEVRATPLLTLSAVIHGNEVAGVSVLADFLNHLADYDLRIPVQVFLGNVEAARRGVRFLERDLNRSFGRNAELSHEDRRARQLEPWMKASSHYIDFHQTILKNRHPFFVFPFHRPSYGFAKALSDDIPIVTHWQGAFSADGMCSDEFVQKAGGIGVTVELGKAGFDPYQRAVGADLAPKAVSVVSGRNPESSMKRQQRLYTWAHVQRVPEKGDVSLVPGLYNFRRVTKGQVLGDFAGKVHAAPFSGYLVFPKYIDSSQPRASWPKELYRIATEISGGELPATGDW